MKSQGSVPKVSTARCFVCLKLQTHEGRDMSTVSSFVYFQAGETTGRRQFWDAALTFCDFILPLWEFGNRKTCPLPALSCAPK